MKAQHYDEFILFLEKHNAKENFDILLTQETGFSLERFDDALEALAVDNPFHYVLATISWPMKSNGTMPGLPFWSKLDEDWLTEVRELRDKQQKTESSTSYRDFVFP